MSKAKPWTEVHAREGRARALEILARLARAGDDLDKSGETIEDAGFDREWRQESSLSFALRLDAAGMRRERRRLLALAEGRLVREHGWRVPGTGLWADENEAKAIALAHGLTAVRVTRIRRAP